jgi:acyl-CoA reductase-like NAD-dependent aldehyde dehydrogenase
LVHRFFQFQSYVQGVQPGGASENWLPPCKRVEILKRLARIVEREFDSLALLIAREGGKPLTDARAEVTRAINGIEGALPSWHT